MEIDFIYGWKFPEKQNVRNKKKITKNLTGGTFPGAIFQGAFSPTELLLEPSFKYSGTSNSGHFGGPS